MNIHRTWTQSRPHPGTEIDQITRSGTYLTRSGVEVDIRSSVARCIGGTKLWVPEEIASLPTKPRSNPQALNVIEADTLFAAQDCPRSMILNFASGTRPGGGWLGTGMAQEESLSHRSALVRSLETVPDFYRQGSKTKPLYTDMAILSPEVPVLRDIYGALLEAPWTVDVLSMAAPNLSAGPIANVEDVLRRRIHLMLKLAAHHAPKRLVLGAWGCGVFKCDPAMVSHIFAQELQDSPLEEVVFAIVDRAPGQPVLETFRSHLG